MTSEEASQVQCVGTYMYTRGRSDLDLNGPIIGRKYLGYNYLTAKPSKIKYMNFLTNL